MTTAPLKVTEMVRKVNSDTPAYSGQDTITMGNTLRFHIPYVGGNAILNPLSLTIRGQFTITSHGSSCYFVDNGIHCLFSTMRVMHGDRVIELIERYDDFAELYISTHNAGRWGMNHRLCSEFCELGNFGRPNAPTTSLLPLSSTDPIHTTTPHEFCFQPLSAVLGLRATKDKFPLCVLNPMEPLVIEFDIDPLGTQVNWTSGTGIGTFQLTNCYLNADYDMVGASLGQQLKTSMSGIEWDIPGLEKHERDYEVQHSVINYPVGAIGTFIDWGGEQSPDQTTEFHVRSNVQAMTRMFHYFKNKNFDRQVISPVVNRRNFLTYPEITRWQYQIANQPVPDRPITAQIYLSLTSGGVYPRAHFGRMWTTTMKTAGEIVLNPNCKFSPKSDFAWDYSKKCPGMSSLGTSPLIVSLTQPWSANFGERGDDGTFFLAYDFTRQPETPSNSKRTPWGEGSFRLRDTEFIVQFGLYNRIGQTGIAADGTDYDVPAYPLVMVTLVEYRRRLVIDKLGRLDAYF